MIDNVKTFKVKVPVVFFILLLTPLYLICQYLLFTWGFGLEVKSWLWLLVFFFSSNILKTVVRVLNKLLTGKSD